MLFDGVTLAVGTSLFDGNLSLRCRQCREVGHRFAYGERGNREQGRAVFALTAPVAAQSTTRGQ